MKVRERERERKRRTSTDPVSSFSTRSDRLEGKCNQENESTKDRHNRPEDSSDSSHVPQRFEMHSILLHFGCDKKILSLELSGLKRLLKRFTDSLTVLIIISCVNSSVSHFQRHFDRFLCDTGIV